MSLDRVLGRSARYFLGLKTFFAIWVILLVCCSSIVAWANSITTITLDGDPVDFDFEGKVCCIDVAAVNLLNYLDRQQGNEKLIEDGKSIKDQQEDFHKQWDPGLTKEAGSGNDLKKGLGSTALTAARD